MNKIYHKLRLKGSIIMAKGNKKRLMLEIGYYFAIIIGALIAGLSYNMLILPNSIAPSGISGVAAIISRFTGISMGILIIALNIPLYIISWRILGLDFGIKSMVGTLVMSLTIDYIPVPAIISEEPLLGAVFGGIMLGAGLGIAFRNTGSTGGTDILAKLISSAFPSHSIGNYVMIMDVIVIVANGLTGENSAFVVLYSLICMYICGFVIDLLQDGVKSAKVYYIITDKGEEIAGYINNELSRGATKIKAVGAYTNEERTMLVCLVLRSEVAKLRRIVKREDPRAFVYVVDAREVSGEGFEAADRKKLL